MRNIIYLFLFIPLCIFSQRKIVAVNSVSKKPIQYATIIFEKGGIYSDENGEFILPNNITKIKISSIGYKNKDIDFIKDTIFLDEKIEKLNEVVIQNFKKSIVIGKKRSKNYVNFTSPYKSTYFAKNFSLSKTSKIEKAHFAIKNGSKERLCRLLIFNIKNGLPYNNILEQNIVTKILANIKDFEINLKQNDIVLKRGNYYLVLEVFDLKRDDNFFKIGFYKTKLKNNSVFKPVFEKRKWESVKTINKKKEYAFNFYLTIKE